MLECLQTILRHDFDRLERVERDASAAQAALVRARAELIAARVAAMHVRHKSMHDELTGLPNRRHFLRRLDQALANIEPKQPGLALLFIDLDSFKSINDANGHLVGDAFLRIIATRLARMVRVEDTMSRLGGDEFACLVSGCSREELRHLAGRLHAGIARSVTIETQTLCVHPSIGIATCPNDGTSPEALMRRADEAMYYAKRHRLGFAFHDSLSAGNG